MSQSNRDSEGYSFFYMFFVYKGNLYRFHDFKIIDVMHHVETVKVSWSGLCLAIVSVFPKITFYIFISFMFFRDVWTFLCIRSSNSA